MSEQAFFWIAGIFAVIVAAIGGALWTHITNDAEVREKTSSRIATLEADNKQNKDEIHGLREDRHDFKDEIKRGTWELVEARWEKFNAAMAAFKVEILRLIGK